jgi:putative multiple sugar transport system substrate-binding protein
MRKTLTALVTMGLALSLAACGGSTEVKGIEANKGATIGLAMPTTTSPRWRNDGNSMIAEFTKMGYKTDLRFAENSPKTQVQQIQTMIDNGDKVLVIAAVDGNALTDVLANAKEHDVKVIAYDRLILGTPNVDYAATFDNFRVGVMQANTLVKGLGLPKAKGPFTLEMFAGSPTDNNTKIFYNGAISILRPYIASGKLVVRSNQTQLSQITTKDWDGAVAGKRMDKIFDQYYRNTRLDAVLAPYDGISRGIIKSAKEHGYGSAAKPYPLVSGQDAEVDSIRDIIAGTQTATIYKDSRELAKVAVQMANALLTGGKPVVNDTTSYNNGVKVVPTYLLPPLDITKANYSTILVDGGYYTTAQLAGK